MRLDKIHKIMLGTPVLDRWEFEWAKAAGAVNGDIVVVRGSWHPSYYQIPGSYVASLTEKGVHLNERWENLSATYEVPGFGEGRFPKFHDPVVDSAGIDVGRIAGGYAGKWVIETGIRFFQRPTRFFLPMSLAEPTVKAGKVTLTITRVEFLENKTFQDPPQPTTPGWSVYDVPRGVKVLVRGDDEGPLGRIKGVRSGKLFVKDGPITGGDTYSIPGEDVVAVSRESLWVRDKRVKYEDLVRSRSPSGMAG